MRGPDESRTDLPIFLLASTTIAGALDQPRPVNIACPIVRRQRSRFQSIHPMKTLSTTLPALVLPLRRPREQSHQKPPLQKLQSSRWLSSIATFTALSVLSLFGADAARHLVRWSLRNCKHSPSLPAQRYNHAAFLSAVLSLLSLLIDVTNGSYSRTSELEPPRVARRNKPLCSSSGGARIVVGETLRRFARLATEIFSARSKLLNYE